MAVNPNYPRNRQPKWLINACDSPQIGDEGWWIDPQDNDKDDISPWSVKVSAIYGWKAEKPTHVVIKFKNGPHHDFGVSHRVLIDDFANFTASDRISALKGEPLAYDTVLAA